MTNKPIDWTQPIELATEPPRPAALRWVCLDGSGAAVNADWFGNGDNDWMPTGNDGFVGCNFPRVRNVATAPDLAAELAEALREIDRRYTAWLAASPKRDVPGVKPGTIRNMGRIARAALAKWEASK